MSILTLVIRLVSCICQKHSIGHHFVHDHSYYIIRAGECSVLYYDDRKRAADIRCSSSGRYYSNLCVHNVKRCSDFFFNWKMSNRSQSVSFSVRHTDFRQQSSAQDGITGAHTGGHVLSWDHERRDLFSTEV